MSGIISAEPFMNYFPETLHNSTWQGFVTAIYEIGCTAPLDESLVVVYADYLQVYLAP
jgi:hypothetical protein